MQSYFGPVDIIGYFLPSDKGRVIFKSGYPVGVFFKGCETFGRKFKGHENFPGYYKGYDNFPYPSRIRMRNDKTAYSTKSFIIFSPFLVPKIS